MSSTGRPAKPTAIPLEQALALQWPILTTEQSRNVDRVAIETHGMSGWTLMQNAAAACVDQIKTLIADPSATIGVLCGPGNNGGDGYVIARDLTLDGFNPLVVCVSDPSRLKGDAHLAFQAAHQAKVRMTRWESFQAGTHATASRFTGEYDSPVWVDALLGTGSRGAPRGDIAMAIRWANEVDGGARASSPNLKRPIRIAIDAPSGWDADTGQSHEPTFRADLTLTFVTPKRGMIPDGDDQKIDARGPSSEPLGRVFVLDIGLPANAKRELGIPDHPSVEPDRPST